MRPGLLVSVRHSLPLVLANIPVVAELPLSACGCRKFQIDTHGDHLCTCTAHSGAKKKKAHDRAVGQSADLFRTTHEVKTQQVARSRGQQCGDIELAGYLAKVAGHRVGWLPRKGGGSGAFGGGPTHRP
jgi:hypothetical protein